MKGFHWISDDDFKKLFSSNVTSDEAYIIHDRVVKSNFEGTFISREKILGDLLDTTLPGVEIRDLIGKIFQ